jgi:hypothetical protein
MYKISLHSLTININPEPTMIQKKYLSYLPAIPSSIPDEDVNNDSSIKLDPSGIEWLGLKNQLGLEPDNQAVGLDTKGKIKHHVTIVIY